MAYKLITPWLNQTYGINAANTYSPYARLAGREFNGGTVSGNIPVQLTDIPRGVSLLVMELLLLQHRHQAKMTWQQQIIIT